MHDGATGTKTKKRRDWETRLGTGGWPARAPGQEPLSSPSPYDSDTSLLVEASRYYQSPKRIMVAVGPACDSEPHRNGGGRPGSLMIGIEKDLLLPPRAA
jgi:hypothetical protein